MSFLLVAVEVGDAYGTFDTSEGSACQRSFARAMLSSLATTGSKSVEMRPVFEDVEGIGAFAEAVAERGVAVAILSKSLPVECIGVFALGITVGLSVAITADLDLGSVWLARSIKEVSRFP